jgi:transposase
LLVALELSSKTWRLAMGGNGRVRQVTVEPGDVVGFEEAISRGKAKLGLAAGAGVVSCYEAGRDGFWVHRWLAQRGVGNVVVDSSSIEVSRRARQAKTDRVDAERLLKLLQRWYGGEEGALRTVRVPSVEDEDGRVLHRERSSWVEMRKQVGNRLRGVLAAQGVRTDGSVAVWGKRLDELRTGDGRPLSPQLRERVERLVAYLLRLNETIRGMEAAQRERIRAAAGQGTVALVELLMSLRGVGQQSAWLLAWELFGWRSYRNRRELAASVGLVGTPYDSGESRREQGVSKSGNRRVRTMLIELAWLWLRHQPESGLSRWYMQRFAGTARGRKVGIVALARKLLIALWQMTQTGEVPTGATLGRSR